MDEAPELWPKDEVGTADEKTLLLGFLHHQREFLLAKASGLTEEQMRTASCPPSNLTMLGLIRHLTDVERGWALRGLAGRQAPPLYSTEDNPEGDIESSADATAAAALVQFRQMIDDVEAVYNDVNLDSEKDSPHGVRYSARWIVVHLIEEYARHLGHADLIRQAIDGQVGEF